MKLSWNRSSLIFNPFKIYGHNPQPLRLQNAITVVSKPKKELVSSCKITMEVYHLLEIIYNQVLSRYGYGQDQLVLYLDFFNEVKDNENKFKVFINHEIFELMKRELFKIAENQPAKQYCRWKDIDSLIKSNTILEFVNQSDQKDLNEINQQKLSFQKDSSCILESRDEYKEFLNKKGIDDIDSHIQPMKLEPRQYDAIKSIGQKYLNLNDLSKSNNYIRSQKSRELQNELLQKEKESRNKVDISFKTEQAMKEKNNDMDWSDNEDDSLKTIEKLISYRYYELTDENKQRIKQIFSHQSNDDLLINKFNTDISYKKIHCLRSSTWLNDEIINFYMEMLAERDELLCSVPGTKRVKSHFFNSFFMERLLNGPYHEKYVYLNVKRWTKKFNIFHLHKILIPINLNNSHWTLGYIDMIAKEIHYYDSMGGYGKKYLNTMLKWIIDEAKEKYNMIIHENEYKLISNHSDNPQQRNGFDCGMFTIICSDFLTDSLPINEKSYNQSKMSYFRNKVMIDVLTGSLNYPIHK